MSVVTFQSVNQCDRERRRVWFYWDICSSVTTSCLWGELVTFVLQLVQTEHLVEPRTAEVLWFCLSGSAAMCFEQVWTGETEDAPENTYLDLVWKEHPGKQNWADTWNQLSVNTPQPVSVSESGRYTFVSGRWGVMLNSAAHLLVSNQRPAARRQFEDFCFLFLRLISAQSSSSAPAEGQQHIQKQSTQTQRPRRGGLYFSFIVLRKSIPSKK